MDHRSDTRRRRPRRHGVVRALGLVLLLAGGGVLAAQWLAPEQTQRVVGAAVGSARQVYSEVARGDAPVTIELGPPGDNTAIDTAPHGIFVEMASYRAAEQLQPVFAAHNGYGGDVILPLAMGDRVDVVDAQGEQREMVVTDARDTPQVGATTGDLSGMAGSILVQTCYWDVDEMRFVALTPVGEEPQTPSIDDATELVVP